MEEELPPPDLLSAILPVLLIVGGIVLFVGLLIGIIALVSRKKTPASEPRENEEDGEISDSPTSYLAQGALLNGVESRFYEALVEAAKGDYWIFPKVRLANVIKVARNGPPAALQSAFRRIASKPIDFAVCIPGNYHVIGLVELDDGSLPRDEQERREAFIDEVTASAGIPVLHIQAEPEYDIEDLTDALREMTTPPADEEPPVPEA